ncbi:MAG: sigma-70 family RNA polymerase sigma factor, partial [Actinomycetota bacterium]|nr:sigma-70 family RNA polymerase sigma factor [Actinomycetota bacterium]
MGHDDASAVASVPTPPTEASRPGADRFEELYRQSYPGLVRFCRRLLGGQRDAEAVAQDAFVRAWTAWVHYEDDRDFWPWVATIARRLCINEVVAGRRRNELFEREVRGLLPRAAEEAGEGVVEAHVVRHALHRLSPRHRRMLALRDVEGWSYEEIAAFDGVTVETVRSSLKRARAAFRHAYHAASRAFGGFVAAFRTLGEVSSRRSPPIDRLAAAAGHLGGWEPMVVGALSLLLATPSGIGHAPAPAPTTWGAHSVAAATGGTTGAASAMAAAVSPTTTAPSTTTSTVPVERSTARSAPPADGASTDPTVGHSYEFTVSPAYETDHTVFASGGTDCGGPDLCSVLLKSTDGGVTWERLPAVGRAAGRVILPPRYPEDARIFSASLANLSVSEDGGNTFFPVGPVQGPATASPPDADGRFRVLFGADLARMVPLATEYRDDLRVVLPSSLPLPKDVAPLAFAFSPGYAVDQRVLVTAVERPQVAFNIAVYLCDAVGCERVLDTRSFALVAPTLWPSSGRGTAFTVVDNTFYRSKDGGRSFDRVPLELDGVPRHVHRLASDRQGRLVMTALTKGEGHGRLFVSDDDGDHWTALTDEEPAWLLRDLVVLPDGAILAAPEGPVAGFRCSVDGGRTWAPTCPSRSG